MITKIAQLLGLEPIKTSPAFLVEGITATLGTLDVSIYAGSTQLGWGIIDIAMAGTDVSLMNLLNEAHIDMLELFLDQWRPVAPCQDEVDDILVLYFGGAACVR